MVADSFQIFGDHQYIHAGVHIRNTLLEPSHKIIFHLREKLIHYIVVADYFVCSLTVPVYKSVYCVSGSGGI